ncbi:5779_t:CDS:2 [Ambispora leptoticha]|uniref:5779_t:CDS:1 n=1 Tax=Ambispora leptoticha TaxID=144679 RepID=A0A9N8V269_9GLOM|nr:5779_t:CDS:2 [Ambispora leptoticha]
MLCHQILPTRKAQLTPATNPHPLLTLPLIRTESVRSSYSSFRHKRNRGDNKRRNASKKIYINNKFRNLWIKLRTSAAGTSEDATTTTSITQIQSSPFNASSKKVTSVLKFSRHIRKNSVDDESQRDQISGSRIVVVDDINEENILGVKSAAFFESNLEDYETDGSVLVREEKEKTKEEIDIVKNINHTGSVTSTSSSTSRVIIPENWNINQEVSLIERLATSPRRSSEPEILLKKGRFTIVRESIDDKKFLSSPLASSCYNSNDNARIPKTIGPSAFTSSSTNAQTPIKSTSLPEPLQSKKLCEDLLIRPVKSHTKLITKNEIPKSYPTSSSFSSPSPKMLEHCNRKTQKPSSLVNINTPRSHSPQFAPIVNNDNKNTYNYTSNKQKLMQTQNKLRPSSLNQQQYMQKANPKLPHLLLSRPSSCPSSLPDKTTTMTVNTQSGRVFEVGNSSSSQSSTGSSNSKRRIFLVETFE